MEISLRGFSCNPPERTDDDNRSLAFFWPYSKEIIANPDATLSYQHSIAFEQDPDLRQRMWDSVLRGYWNTLVNYVPSSGFRPPRDKKITVLDLGCGDALYAMVLKAYFEGNKNHTIDSGNKVRYLGVDIDQSYLALAEKTFKNSPGYQFIQGDARYLERYPEIPDKVEVVILRHPGPFLPFLEGSEVWPDIFQAAVNKVKKNGFILITCYAESEKDELLKILGQLPKYQVILAGKNPYGLVAGTSNHPEYKFDQWVVVARVK